MQIEGGYILQPRCIEDSDIAHTAPHTREIWFWLLRQVNHQDSKFCKRGQCIKTSLDIREGLSWYSGWRKHMYSKAQIENSLGYFREHGMVTTRKTARGIVITICKYDIYQDPNNYDYCSETKRATAGLLQTPATIYKNDKNVRNKNNIYINSKEKINKKEIVYKHPESISRSIAVTVNPVNEFSESLTQSDNKISTIAKFEASKEIIVAQAKVKYPDKNVDAAIVDFIWYLNTKKTKYKDFKLAFFNWVREDRFQKYGLGRVRTIGTRNRLAIC